jgi:hypothetical protein
VCVALLLPLTLVFEPTAFNLAYDKYLVRLIHTVLDVCVCVRVYVGVGVSLGGK